MSSKAQSERYSTVAIVLHWLVALVLGGMIATGHAMHGADGRPVEWMFQLHKSFGITLLALMIARVVWRALNPPPALPESVNAMEAKVSHGVHMGLYAVCFLLPLTGWIMVSVSPFAIATVVFGTISWPHLPWLADLSLATRQSVYPNIEQLHGLLSWVLVALFALHFVGAIKHELSNEEGVMKRMFPKFFGQTTPPKLPSRGTLTAFGTAAIFFGSVASAPVIAESMAPATEAVHIQLTTEPNWAVDHETSTIEFSGTHDGNTFTGAFNNWSADIAWDPENTADGQAVVTVQTASAETGNSLYDNTLDAAEWLDPNGFPAATVTIKNVTADGEHFIADAKLTIKETTITTPFTFSITYEGDTATMRGEATLTRADLNLGQDSDPGGDWVSPEIAVAVTINASRL